MKPTGPIVSAFLSGLVCAGILGYILFRDKPAAASRAEPSAYVTPKDANPVVSSEPEPAAPPAATSQPRRASSKPRPVSVVPSRKPEAAQAEPLQPVTIAHAEPPPAIAPESKPAEPLPSPTPVQSEPERPQLMKPDPMEQKRAREERTAETVTLPAGTVIHIRLNQPLSSERNENGDSFNATLMEPVVANGFVIAERGARIDGVVVDAVRAGKVKGLARISVRLTTLHTSDNQRVAILTDDFVQNGPSSKGTDAAKMGAGAGIGAALGAIFGGGKGAAIGAAAGGAAGGGTVLLTRGRPAELEVEAKIPFRLREPVTITESR